MSIALEQFEELHHMEGEVRQRPNGPRVLRLLRELSYIDGKLANSIRHAGDFPLVTVALAAVFGFLVLAVVNLPSAQSASAPASTSPAVVDISAEQHAASAQQAQAYTNWLGQAHAQAAVQGSDTPALETF